MKSKIGKSFRSSSRGQVAVLTAIMLPVLFGFAALALDVGSFETTRRSMQTAADSAARAGALELLTNNDASMLSAARNDASINGYTDGVNNVTVTVNNPPTGGAYKTVSGTPNDNAVEVIIKGYSPTYFMRALSVNSVPISVRAVAAFVDDPHCIYVLNQTASSAFSLNGTGSFTSACGVIVDSSSSSAVSVNGSVSLTAPAIDVVGGYAGGNYSPTPTTGVAAATDPLIALPAPTVGSCDYTNFQVRGTTTTLNPGVYCGGITMAAKSNVTFNSGMYILAGGGMSTQGNGTLNGSGVTFYITSAAGYPYGEINFQGSSTVTLSAPTSGTYEGILFFQDRTISAAIAAANPNTITGGSKSTYNGALYFPTTSLTYQGNITISDGPYTLIVADKLTLGGSITSIITATVSKDYSSLTNGSPIKGAPIVE